MSAKLTIQPEVVFQLHHSSRTTNLSSTIRLLQRVKQTGNLRKAAHHCGYSYRKAWDLLKDQELILDQVLVVMHRGRGSQLSDFGEQLLQLITEHETALNEQLTASCKQINDWLTLQQKKPQTISIIASDSEKLNRLKQKHPDLFRLQIEGSEQALTAYQEKKCTVAGFHLPIGKPGLNILQQYQQFLSPTDRFIILEQRSQGIISHPKHPVTSIQQIVDQQLTFVNRQIGSGTRSLFDHIIQDLAISSENIPGYHHEQHTHLAVASLVASQQADACLGVYAVAEQLNLHFSPLSAETYFLVYSEASVNKEALLNLLNHLNVNPRSELLSYAEFIAYCKNPADSILPSDN